MARGSVRGSIPGPSAAWILLALTACQPPEHDLIRLAELRAQTQADEAPTTVLESARVDPEPLVLPVDLSGARIDRLTLVARGDAPTVDLGWKLASERRLSRFRKLTVPLVADGEEHRYTIDLSQEPYWIGPIDRLQLAVPEGALEIVELLAHPGGTARTAALDGLSMPSLPGLDRLELELPEDAPRHAIFEVHLGLAPQFDRPGAKVRFRVRAGSEERPAIWLDETLEGGGERRWKRVAHEVEVPAGARLTLEVEAARHGQPLPEGAAMWGAPILAPLGAEDGPPSPHLVILAVDTLRADAMGAYGSQDGLTPALDRLAARSVRFADLEVPSSWTLPSMASLLTGLQPQTHDTGRTLGDEDFAPTALGPAMPTLARVLAQRGFTTIGVYNNIFLGPSFGVSRGFDLYHWIEEEDDVLVDRAIELLRRYRNERRMFVMLHLFGPHNPYAPPGDSCATAKRLMPERGDDANDDATCTADRRPGNPVPPRKDWAWIEALYKAEVAYTDRQIGRFLEALDEMGLGDEVVLLVVSDHGEDFWGRFDRLGGLGGYEDADHGHTLYRELLHVPGLLQAPDLTPRVIEDPVELVDFFPTLLTLLGIDQPVGNPEGEGTGEEAVGLRDLLQGEDLAPVLRDPSLRPSRRTRVADFLLYGASRRSIRRGPWKLILPTDGREGEAPSGELYNLDEDPGERNDRHAARPEVVEQLRQIGEKEVARREELRRQLQAGQDALHAAHLQWNHITKLRALGYLK